MEGERERGRGLVRSGNTFSARETIDIDVRGRKIEMKR
jgi:hypothetical protein